MRDAPAYSAERFPGDFLSSLLTGLVTGSLLGVLGWWLARRYLIAHNPGHPELLSAAIVVGLIDGVLLGMLASAAWFALRIWRFERQTRKASDDALRRYLQQLDNAPPHTPSTGEPNR